MSHIHDTIKWKPRWTIRKYQDDAAFEAGQHYEESVIDGNLLLTEGITAMWTLIVGGGGTAFSNANAHLGVGDSSTAAAAGQTGLQASSNKLYKAMAATYPQVAGAACTWRAVFTGAEANFAWQEFTVASGNSDAATNMNRVVSNQGTKTAGQTWTLDLQITLG